MLSDLGLAKRTDETSHLTAARQGFGTPYYMSYEQAINARFADARSDIYALGTTLYHLLTGDIPFKGDTTLELVEKKSIGLFRPASELNKDVPAVIDRILDKMLALNPGDRYQTASELIVDLERTGLVAQVLSFATSVDPDVARQSSEEPAETSAADRNQFWYLRYRDRQGRLCKAKATMAAILKHLEEGKLSDQVEVSLQPQGEFLPLAQSSHFQSALKDAKP